jgi:hypothetical protein
MSTRLLFGGLLRSKLSVDRRGFLGTLLEALKRAVALLILLAGCSTGSIHVPEVKKAAQVQAIPLPTTLAAPKLSAVHPLRAQTASVQLAWIDTDPTVVLYHLYYGIASQTYTSMVSTTLTNETVSNLFVGTNYYFAATALNETGLESAYSVEVSYQVPRKVWKSIFQVSCGPLSLTVTNPPYGQSFWFCDSNANVWNCTNPLNRFGGTIVTNIGSFHRATITNWVQ